MDAEQHPSRLQRFSFVIPAVVRKVRFNVTGTDVKAFEKHISLNSEKKVVVYSARLRRYAAGVSEGSFDAGLGFIIGLELDVELSDMLR
mmetsp:Transcript_57582/g.68735  ORF Transcript_57582/g.68735 Transcript_57582/m.68735 type:complete len:89 (-) Transcript_57582:697-963(-)